MRAGPKKLVGAATALSIVLLNAATAAAQLVQSEVGAEPGDTDTVQLVTSSTEVRRAVVGLLALAFVLGVLGIVYWYKTGQLARERHQRAHSGRHGANRSVQSARRPRPGSERADADAPSSHRYPDASPRLLDANRSSRQRGSWRRDLLG